MTISERHHHSILTVLVISCFSSSFFSRNRQKHNPETFFKANHAYYYVSYDEYLEMKIIIRCWYSYIQDCLHRFIVDVFIRSNIHFQWLWIFNISLSMNSKNVENDVNEPKQYEMVVWTQNGISCGHSDMSLGQLSQR